MYSEERGRKVDMKVEKNQDRGKGEHYWSQFTETYLSLCHQQSSVTTYSTYR